MLKDKTMKKHLLVTLIIFTAACGCSAVMSKMTRHKSFEDFSKGKTHDTVISSRGTISLASATQVLAEDFNDVWTINSIVSKDDGSIYLGTSPNGRIYEYKNGKTACIYPSEPAKAKEPNKPAAKHFTNQHIFKLALDSSGDILAGVSGDKCCLLRYNGKKFEKVFEPEPNQASYIFAIALDKSGNIFLGTGPNGKIFRLDKKCRNPQLVYTCEDKNILCLAVGDNGFLYAGTDTRGLIYKIDPKANTATVLYDSSQNEITDLLFDSTGNLYAAATSYKSIKAGNKGESELKPFAPGKPEIPEPKEPSDDTSSDGGTSLTIANAPPEMSAPENRMPKELERGRPADDSSHIYKIDSNGFVTDIFNEPAVFFAIYMQKDKLLLGTGNKAQLFSINPGMEIETLVYEDNLSSQITDIKKLGDDIIFSTANPAKLIKLKSAFAKQGTYESPLIDADQPAQWGKLQIEADIPADTKILVSTRSGNVDDVNDPAFSPWTEPVKIMQPVDITAPLGRFCQYKLILLGKDTATPVIREVAAAYVIPNLAPKVTQVTVERDDKNHDTGIFKIDFSADDENGDQLVYKIDFRKKGRSVWIQIVDDLDKTDFDWDSKTVEDGIYELRITASDKLSNNPASALTGSRITEPVTVDNTAPVIEKHQLQIKGKTATLTLKAVDQFSTISSLGYAIDSNEKWISALPDDNIFDTMTEDFTIKTEDLTPGPHVLAVRISDAPGNTMYKTFDIEIK